MFFYWRWPIVTGKLNGQTIYLAFLNSFHVKDSHAYPRFMLIDDDSGDGIYKIREICERVGVKATFAVVPAFLDSARCDSLRKWQQEGYGIALHGYDHVCVTNQGGINPVHQRSEFAGLDYEAQAKKISDGYQELKRHRIETDFFFAPSHTYDKNTLRAIIDNTPIRKISDTIATKPYKMKNGVIVVPCQMGRCREMLIPGYWTACYHPNMMDDRQFEMLDAFLKKHNKDCISFKDIPLSNISSKTILDRILSFCYFSLKKLKG